MIFQDLLIGDKFEVGGEVMIKVGNNRPFSKPLSERATNAINLRNGHQMVIGEKVKVRLIEEVRK